MPDTEATRVAPTTKRVPRLDVLRGVALLGILVVNMEYYSQTIYDGWLQDVYRGGWDLAARWVVIAFFQLKAYLLFALLFGYGIGMQAAKDLDTSRSGARRRHVRRLVALALFGVLHAVLLFVGDILLTYALLGLLGLTLWSASVDRLMTVARLAFVVAVVLSMAVIAAIGSEPVDPAYIDWVRGIYAHGTVGQIIAQRAEDASLAFVFVLLVQGPMAFAMLLAGMAMARERVLIEPERHADLLRRWRTRWLPIGVAGGVLAATLSLIGDGNDLGAAVGFFVQVVSGPAFCLGVIALIVHVCERLPVFVFDLLRDAGRVSLSTYIGESVICAFLFTGYGLGWFAQVGPALCLALSVPIFVVLAVAGRLWLARWRFGPLEWVLRSITYWRWQPLRR